MTYVNLFIVVINSTKVTRTGLQKKVDHQNVSNDFWNFGLHYSVAMTCSMGISRNLNNTSSCTVN